MYIFIFVGALRVDYNIFLAARVREEARQFGTRQGTLRRLSVTGDVITAAGVVLAATFAALIVEPTVYLTEVGTAVAIGVDSSAAMVTMMFWYGGGWGWWQAGLMWIAMIAFWGLLIWAIWALVSSAARRTGRPGSDDHPEGRARRILDERLARGEIDAEEYRRLRDTLGGRSGNAPAAGEDVSATAGPARAR